MRRAYVSSLVILAWASLAPLYAAPPTLELPKEVTGDPGSFIQVAAKTDGKQVSWRAVDPGLNLFPVELLKDSKVAVVTAPRPGRYRLWAVTAGGDEPSPFVETIVVISGTPIPPDPPEPPDPPGPTDPLLQPLQAAYLAEPLATRSADKAALSAVYYACAGAVKPANGTSTIKTAGELFTVIRGSTDARISDRLKGLRSIVGGELEKILPTDPSAALTDFRRQETYDALTRFAALLNEVK